MARLLPCLCRPNAGYHDVRAGTPGTALPCPAPHVTQDNSFGPGPPSVCLLSPISPVYLLSPISLLCVSYLPSPLSENTGPARHLGQARVPASGATFLANGGYSLIYYKLSSASVEAVRQCGSARPRPGPQVTDHDRLSLFLPTHSTTAAHIVHVPLSVVLAPCNAPRKPLPTVSTHQGYLVHQSGNLWRVSGC